MIPCATVPASSCSISSISLRLFSDVRAHSVRTYVDSCGDMRIFIVVRMQYVSHKVAKIIFFADRCESHVTKNIHRPLIFFTGPTVLKCCVGVASECDARRTKRQNDNCIYLDGNWITYCKASLLLLSYYHSVIKMQYVAILVLLTLAVASAFMPMGNVARYSFIFDLMTNFDVVELRNLGIPKNIVLSSLPVFKSETIKSHQPWCIIIIAITWLSS